MINEGLKPPRAKMKQRAKPSFAQALSGMCQQPVVTKERVILGFVGGNITVAINDNEYKAGLAEFEFTLIGRLNWRKETHH